MSPPSLKKNTYFLRSGTPQPSTTTTTSTSTSTTPAAKEDPTPPSPPDVPRRHSVAPSIERWMQHVFASPSSTSSTSSSSTTQHQRIHNPLDPRYLGNIPFSYTTDKLRQWGAVYLNNTATADAFVRAIPLPLPLPLLQKRIVRVRVCGPHRMFYMQKAFPRVGARCASRPLLQPYKRRLPVPMRMLCSTPHVLLPAMYDWLT